MDDRCIHQHATRHQHAFFDVRVFNSLAPSNRSSSLSATYRRHEQEKRHAYEERVREVEHGCFTPLVFSTAGGMGKAATVAYKRLAHLLSARRDTPYPMMMDWLHCSLSFSLLKLSIMCIRGSRSRSGHPGSSAPADLVLAESRVSPLPP